MQVDVTHIIFDWDGTLMDSEHKIVTCMQQAAECAGLSAPSAEQVKNIIGISLQPAIEILFNIAPESAHIVANHYRRIFVELDQVHCPLFPHVNSTLSQLLPHVTMGVATGKARRGLERAWEATNSKRFFDFSVCSDEAESKPSPDMLLKVLAKWKVPVKQVLMVGDTEYDMQMAAAIQMPRVGVSFGVHHQDRLIKYQPLTIIDCISELPKLVLR